MKNNSNLNHLADETSPYLLQHAHNPVNWYPWSDEAFAKAKIEGKPIFLSIGYSTCHWCHVMAHESFEDSVIAQILNENFISIKVDREERPDIDQVYMDVCMALTGRGGWPLTIIMTPDKKPFFAGTYFQKESVGNRTGLVDILNQVQTMWKSNRNGFEADADRIIAQIKERLEHSKPTEPLGDIRPEAIQQYKNTFDGSYGGFGRSPKFPSAHNLIFLMREAQIAGDNTLINMVSKTLTEMRLGGIYDQIGFGFHRYSTDEMWHLPHFEKMLYDQAMLMMAYTEAYAITRNPLFKQTVEELHAYLVRDMKSDNGAFYSAEDADSEGEEGKFYVWSYTALKHYLSDDEFSFIQQFQVFEDGNFQDEATHQLSGLNIFDPSFDASNMTLEWNQKWEKIRQKLIKLRSKRIRPSRDEKILVDWNGMLLAAFSKAARTLQNPEIKETAHQLGTFLLQNSKDKNGRLIHRWSDQSNHIPAFLDDYAFLIWGFREWYELEWNEQILETSIALQQEAIDYFWDNSFNAFDLAPHDGEKHFLSKKDIYDGAYPSGNSISALNLFYLSKINAKTNWETMALNIGNALSVKIMQYPMGHAVTLWLKQAQNVSFQEITISVGKNERKDILNTLETWNWPWRVIVYNEPKSNLNNIIPYLSNQIAIDNQTTLYVCENHTCRLPTFSKETMESLLKNAYLFDND